MRKTSILSTAFAVIVAAVVSLTPTTGEAAKAQKTGYLQDYARLGHVGGVPVEQVWIDPDFSAKDYSSLYVAPVQVHPGSTRDPQTLGGAQMLAKAMQKDLVERLRATEMFAVVSGDDFMRKGDKSVLVLQTRITVIDNGGNWMRKIVGFSPKAATVQLEGKVFDARYKRSFIEFADKRVNHGSVPMMGYCNTTDPGYLNGVSLKNISKGIVEMLAYTKENIPMSAKPPRTHHTNRVQSY